jgi:hypothetical protein
MARMLRAIVVLWFFLFAFGFLLAGFREGAFFLPGHRTFQVHVYGLALSIYSDPLCRSGTNFPRLLTQIFLQYSSFCILLHVCLYLQWYLLTSHG